MMRFFSPFFFSFYDFYSFSSRFKGIAFRSVCLFFNICMSISLGSAKVSSYYDFFSRVNNVLQWQILIHVQFKYAYAYSQKDVLIVFFTLANLPLNIQKLCSIHNSFRPFFNAITYRGGKQPEYRKKTLSFIISCCDFVHCEEFFYILELNSVVISQDEFVGMIFFRN